MLNQSMYFTSPNKGPLSVERHGTVLLIVLVILTMFAGIGIAFMFYAESEANSAAAFREQFEFRGPDMDPEMAFAMFMQQLIFDCRDDASGITSALRGHGLYRNMYGLKYISSGGSVVLATPAYAFSGSGRQHWTYGVTPGMPTTPGIFNGVDDYGLINYSYFPSDGFVRYPEYLGTTPQPLPKGGLTFTQLPYIGGANPPYSAADPNFMALAAVKADGTILVPSFHRDWIPNGFGSLDPSNPNWKAADPTLKYKVLRPRPGDHPDIPFKGKKGFPLPMDAFGDVRNRPIAWAGTGNDSFWMYTGAPILTLPDGRRYTALFAPLIIDLDGKLNINVAGNLVGGANDTFCGNSGIAPSEMNPNRILSFDSVEWKNLLIGMKTPIQRLMGRYGANFIPAATGTTAPSPLTSAPRFYALIDSNGRLAPGSGPNNPWTMPGAYQSWPTYSTGYGNALPVEMTNHPMTYNPMGPANGDRIFLPGEMNMLYRYGDTNTDSMLCDLWQLLPNNLKDVKKRNLITTLSFDRRDPGFAPWLYNPTNPNRYELNGVATKPTAPPLASPTPGSANTKEYGGVNWRNTLPQALKYGYKIDLNLPIVVDASSPAATFRALWDYPAPNASNQITDVTNFNKAQLDRQMLARDLWFTLIKSTGAFDISTYNKASTLTTPTAGEIDALRYLAQLAVNMVDYIDTDDYITPFNWVQFSGSAAFQSDYAGLVGQAPATPYQTIASSWVYGTELPKVVINEAYCQYSNDPNEPDMLLPPATKKATYYNVDIWAELCNPFKSDGTMFGSGAAHLYAGSNPVYRILVTDKNAGMNLAVNTEGRPDNQPAAGAVGLDITKVKTVVDTEFNKNPGTTTVINPINTSFLAPTNQGSNTGFYVVGPADASNAAVPFPSKGAAPIPKATVDAKGMRYKFNLAAPLDVPKAPTLVLQRLLCPYRPYDPNGANTQTYNPYITVDYFEIPDSALNKAITQNGTAGGIETPVDVEQRMSIGRLQSPYSKSLSDQKVPSPNQPQHTFFYHNYQPGVTMPSGWPVTAPANYPAFKWLVHLDRNLISPMELLHVSGYKPHQLTQFFTGSQDFLGGLTGHQAPWFDSNTRLYRFFEFVQTGPRMAGTNGPRIPGKMNINTIWDPEVFMALCDPQSFPLPNPPGPSHFNDVDVGKIYQQMLALRNTTGGLPGPGDQYFMPFSAGVVPAGDTQFSSGQNINNTLLRPFFAAPNPDPRRLFELENDNPSFQNRTHAYQRFEMLTKIYNNITTRSNCFAVWVTVGFFEVNDVAANGAISLGQEIGRSEGRNIRHKMFAIVDRSVLDPFMTYTIPAGGTPKTLDKLVGGILDQTIPFNPHATGYRELVPYYIVVE